MSSKYQRAQTSSDANELAQLAQVDDEDVRKCVADNTYTPPEVLARLARDKHRVRYAVAGNWSTPQRTLAKLAGDNGYMIRAMVARNENTHVKTLIYLADDGAAFVRESVAHNPHTPQEIRFMLYLEHPEWAR